MIPHVILVGPNERMVLGFPHVAIPNEKTTLVLSSFSNLASVYSDSALHFITSRNKV